MKSEILSMDTAKQIADLKKENERLNNIIKELEKWVKEYAEKDTMSSIIFGVVLEHLEELKGGQ